MTLYYLAAAGHPLLGQHRYSDWKSILHQKIARIPCRTWNSLPARYCRIIDRATRDAQSERWDVTRILGELQRLNEALKGSRSITAAELFAEEIAFRTAGGADSYEWNEDKLNARAELNKGFTLSISGDENNGIVKVGIQWLQTGDRRYDSVKKYIGPARDHCVGCLKKGGWRIDGTGVSQQACEIEASVQVRDLRGADALERSSDALNSSLSEIRSL